MTESPSRFEWRLYPEAEAWLTGCLDELAAQMPEVRVLTLGFEALASCRLRDWLDHIVVVGGESAGAQLTELGFEPEEVDAEPGDRVYHHPGAILPRVLLRDAAGRSAGSAIGAFLLVDEIASFLMANRRTAFIEGTPLSLYRRAVVWQADGLELGVVERRGHSGFVPLRSPASHMQRCLRARELWATRPRQFKDTPSGMSRTLDLAKRLVAQVGRDAAASIFLEVERAYWQQRNRAGQVQKARQDALGLGWANSDHCAFRSSRSTFAALIEILKVLGFRPRERFYAGAEAGWGAQVMEQPVCRAALFCDVDLSPDEVAGDFSATPLAPRRELGTIGLWCALHGESILDAGTHHLAARFDFDALSQALAGEGIKTMRPFSEFPYLRQAFTRGERWSVYRERLDRLVDARQITPEQRAQFAEGGALGSHLENIQRGQGFRGFNQQMVSDIIQRTDPRLADGG